MRPEKGTPEYRLWIAAIEVAMAAPLSHGPTTTDAKVYWPKIEALRAALDELGVNWRPRDGAS
jgi:hypothetical protein